MMMVRKKRAAAVVVHLLFVSILLSGCASKYGPQITNVKYYQGCYQPIQDLRTAEKQFNTTVAGSAVAGAVLGAIIGGVATGDARGALAGAVVGGVAGGMAGYALAKQQQIKDDNQRLVSYLQDIDGDISGLDRVTAAAQLARQCYDSQFQSAVATYQQGQMSRAELNERYAEISSGSLEASRILGNVISSASTKDAQYQEALKSEAQIAKRPVPEPVKAQPVVAEPEPTKPKSSKKHKVKGKDKPAETTPQPEPDKAKVAKAPARAPAPETGDKLTDFSSRQARLADGVNDAKEEKAQIEKAEADRKKTMDIISG